MTGTPATIACEQCGKNYGWRAELAGRKVRCRCGNVIRLPATPDAADELYDLAEQPAAPVQPAAASNVAAISPATGRRMPQPSAALNYRAPREDGGVVDQYFPDRVKDLYAPLGLIAGGTLIHFLAGVLTRPRGTGAAVVMAELGAEMIIGTVLMLIGILLAAKFRGISFGPFWTAVMKLAAISIAPGAVVTLLGPVWRFIPLVGGLVGWVVSFILYFALLGALFDLDESDTWYCVMVIFLVKLAVYFLLIWVAISSL